MIKKSFFYLISFLALICFCFSSFADFFPGTDDVPLMEDITLPDTGDFSFDTPAGQILVFEGKTNKSADEVRSFYAQTLTALGWTWQKKDYYTRGKDTFQLSFPKPNEVRFDITLNSVSN